MRFGKRLALAMIRDAGEVPYISQKPLKHILVGLEKLCKSFTEQEVNRLSSHSESELIEFANAERVKYGLEERPSLLTKEEVISHDSKLFQLMDVDVATVRRYVELCESSLMESMNEWLEEAAHIGLLEGVAKGAAEVKEDEKDELVNELVDLKQEFSRIKQYIEVNITALRKLIARRNKNVPQIYWSSESYENIQNMQSDETEDIERLVDSLVAELR